MLRNEKTEVILRQFRRKSKRILNRNHYTEFFYLNKERKVIEFLEQNGELLLEKFFKEFLPSEIRDFVKLKLLNEDEEEIRTWYYEEENLVLLFSINWGSNRTEINFDIDIENFKFSIIDNVGLVGRCLDHDLLNEYLISVVTTQANYFSQTFKSVFKCNLRRSKKRKEVDSKNQTKSC